MTLPSDYVYDERGRLVTVRDLAGEVARYTYDAAGNVTAIAREARAASGIVDFNPRGGAKDTTVTILGQGFDPTLTGNTVMFGTVAATVGAATARHLVVRVPAGAATAEITVVTPTATLTSTRQFRVPPPGPVITAFDPRVVTAGATITITGQNFLARRDHNSVSLNGLDAVVTAATTTSLTVTVPTSISSGPVSVATPYGTATTTMDVFVPIPPLTVDDVGFTGRITAGTPLDVPLPTADKVGMVVFSGEAGTPVALTASASTYSVADISIFKPDNNLLTARSYTANSPPLFFDAMSLPLTGTYTILVSPRSSATGTMTLLLQSVPAVDSGPITADGPAVTVRTTAAGQNAVRTFNGSADQRITLTVSDVAIDVADIAVLKPDGFTLTARSVTGGQPPLFFDTLVLPIGGTYSVSVDPRSTFTGSLTLALASVPPDDTGPITIDAPATTLTITTAGQNAVRTFTGTSGQRITLT
ncbi:MAG: Filamin-C, partial [Pseudonocardiales bacterium]|nr:Filamin-C [Pseudonocardiales bacterium]